MAQAPAAEQQAPAPAAAPATKPATAPAKPQPATAPATAPVPPPPGPKAVALAFAAAIDRGDIDTAKSLAVPDPAHAQWVECTVKLATSLKKLDAASAARWGDAGQKVSQNALGMRAALAALPQAQQKIDGPRATLTVANFPEPPLRLRHIEGGAWRVEAPASGDALARQLRLYEMLARAAERTAAEVAAGEHATADDAAGVFARRLLRARIRAV